MKQKEAALVEHVETLRHEAVALCRDLVRINTVNPYSGGRITGLEKDGQAFLKPILEAMGARATLFEPPPDIYERMGVLGPKGRSFESRPNLVAEFDFGADGPTLILNGHMDTVDVSGMTVEPFGGEIRDGRVWGRGASDCKGGLAAAIVAIKALLPFRVDLRGKILLESAVDEECSGSGAGTLACCLAGYRGDAAVVVDGNDLDITLGCGGCLTADLRVQGQAGHAAHGGISAVDKAIIIKSAIDCFDAERRQRFPNVRVNLGVFNAGVHAAVVPGSAYLSLNIVYALPEAQAAEDAGEGFCGLPVRRAFEKTIRATERNDPWLAEHPAHIEWVKDLIPFETPQDARIIRDLFSAFRASVGRDPRVHTVPAWLDATYLHHFAQTPVVVFGPGLSTACHASDENVPVENLVNAGKAMALYLYRRLAR